MRIAQSKWDWVLHPLTTFKYEHLMENTRIMVVRYGINDAGQWDHIGEDQLVVLTSPVEPTSGLKMGDTIDPNTWAFRMSGL